MFKREKIGNSLLYLLDSDRIESDLKSDLEKINIRNYGCNETEEELQLIEDIVGHYDEADYHSQITERVSWAAMYQLAETRANIIDWLNIPHQAEVLELGAGCGAITNVLLKKGAHVTCQEENLRYSRMNAARHKQAGITVYAMPFTQCEAQLAKDYDVIVFIGVPLVKGNAEAVLRKLRGHLKPQGMLILATENKFGLKYWAGNKEVHTHRYFAGLENAGIQLYSGKALRELLAQTGFEQQEFYYPYPDYRFTQDLFSDRHLPKKGELTYNIANYEDDRILVFDEQKVYDSIIEEGQFPFFSNSYLCLAGGEAVRQEVDYVRYAADRSREHAVRTDIRGNCVFKCPMYPQGASHVAHIAKAYEKLCGQYEDTDLKFNRCKLHTKENGEIYAEFEFIQAQALQAQIEHAVAADDMNRVFDILHRMVRYIRNSRKTVPFAVTDDFLEVFGEVEGVSALQGAVCSEVSDADLILPNILAGEDGTWNVIDYEWTFFFPIPQNFVIYRTLFFLNHENPEHTSLSMERLLDDAGISQEEAEIYARMEEAFQRYVTGGLVPYREMVNLLKRRFLNITELKEEFDRVLEYNELLRGRGFWKIARTIKKKLTGN